MAPRDPGPQASEGIYVRLGVSLRERVDAYAKAKGISRKAALQVLIDRQLTKEKF